MTPEYIFLCINNSRIWLLFKVKNLVSGLDQIYFCWYLYNSANSPCTSGMGLLCTALTAIIFMRYNTTPIIMASGRELCYVLLSGIALCYVMTFIILAPPSKTTCYLLRVGLGLGLCICYSAIFTKTNRISRIFNRGVRSIKRPSYTSPRSQIVICFGEVFVEELICCNNGISLSI